MRSKETILIILIFILSAYYYNGNFSKLTYVYEKFFVAIFKGDNKVEKTDIVQVEIKSPSFKSRKSFVRDVVHNSDGEHFLFMNIPEGVSLSSIENDVFIDEYKALGQSINENILLSTHGEIRVYIINKNYKENVAQLLSTEIL